MYEMGLEANKAYSIYEADGIYYESYEEACETMRTHKYNNEFIESSVKAYNDYIDFCDNNRINSETEIEKFCEDFKAYEELESKVYAEYLENKANKIRLPLEPNYEYNLKI
jgi:hypothetical protein